MIALQTVNDLQLDSSINFDEFILWTWRNFTEESVQGFGEELFFFCQEWTCDKTKPKDPTWEELMTYMDQFKNPDIRKAANELYFSWRETVKLHKAIETNN